MIQSFELPWAAKPKPRPRVTKHGTYNPKDYTEWKEDIAEYLGVVGFEPHVGRVEVRLAFGRSTTLVIVSDSDRMRHGRYDIDNGCGGVLDALQEATLITNDRDVVELKAHFSEEQA